MKKIKSLRKIILHNQGHLVRARNTVLANYYFNSLDTLVEALRVARIFFKSPDNYLDIRRQILEKLWSIRNAKRIGQLNLIINN